MDDDAPPGVPEWVVTYGDMMSLLLTFFIMLVSMSEVKADRKYRAVLASLTESFGYVAGPAAPSGENFPLSSLIERLDTLGSHGGDKGRGGLKRPGSAGDDLRVLRNRAGRPVSEGGLTFPAGSAELTPAGRSRVAALAAALAGKPNKIDVRGYAPERTLSESRPAAADRSVPVVAPKPDRRPAPRELAYRRAKAVLVALEAAGLRHDRLRLSTVVEPADAAAASDRVEVFALDQHSGDLVGPRAE